MVQIILKKGLSYSGIVNATKKNPLVITDEETAKIAVSTGYFDIVEVIEAIVTPTADDTLKKNSDADIVKKAIKKMTTAELDAYAEEKGIDISGCTNNDQRVALIKEIEEKENGKEEVSLTADFSSGE